MKAEYKRDLKDNYLILSALEEKEEDDYSIYMVEKNRIPGLLPLHRSRMDGALLLNYEITGKQPLTGLYERRQLGSADILSILSELGDVLETLQKYLLSPENLVFDPEYIFLEPDGKKLCLCYAPGVKNEASIRSLAEFILRRLDHRDASAVTAGYRFYGKTLEENFSLQSSLKELLLEYQERDKIPAEHLENQEVWNESSGKDRWQAETARYRETGSEEDTRGDEIRTYGENKRSGYDGGVRRGAVSERRVSSGYAAAEYSDALLYEEPQVIHKTRRKNQTVKEESLVQKEAGNTEKGNRGGEKDKKGRTEKDRSTEEGSSERFVDRIFRAVHPAVLLSALFLLAALEILFYLGYLQLTETGGAFFLVLSAELLINSFWKRAKEEKQKQNFERWVDEAEEDEEYQELMQEMYRRPNPAAQPEEIGETRCLSDLKHEEELRLIPVQTSENADPVYGRFPDIIVRRDSVTVGKLRQRCDVVLMTPAISRMHARLEYRQGVYYLKDLNSRNGTFLNGERLMPQEAREIDHGDRVAFADIQYRAVRM